VLSPIAIFRSWYSWSSSFGAILLLVVLLLVVVLQLVV
jgi:hypothetical protein